VHWITTVVVLAESDAAGSRHFGASTAAPGAPHPPPFPIIKWPICPLCSIPDVIGIRPVLVRARNPGEDPGAIPDGADRPSTAGRPAGRLIHPLRRMVSGLDGSIGRPV